VQGLSLSRRQPSTEDLRKQIVNAFQGRAYPGDDRIALADDRHPDYEGHRVARVFRGRDWREVTYPWLSASYPGDRTAILRFMQDEGFLYYLPAFLSLALDSEAGDIADAVSYALTAPPASAADDGRRFHARISRLSGNEKAAVTAVLSHLAKQDGPGSPAQDALQSYWTSAPA
jgi:hypothetical protein